MGFFRINEPFMRPCLGNEARKAVEQWHYSHVCPAFTFGYSFFTPDSKFIGVVLFGRGANRNIGSPYGLEQSEVLELVRVALNGMQGHGQTSRIVAAAIRQVREDAGPSLKMLVSYSDQDQGHAGTIYQATNWIYAGETGKYRDGWVTPAGQFIRNRSSDSSLTSHGLGGDSKKEQVEKVYGKGLAPHYTLGRHRYLYPFTKDMKKVAEAMRQPYPRKGGQDDSLSAD